MSQGKKIGEINGWKSRAFEWALALLPLFLVCQMGVNGWLVTLVLSLQPGVPRYSRADAERDQRVLWDRVDERFDQLPPKDWRERISKLESKLDSMQKTQVDLLIEFRSMKGKQ